MEERLLALFIFRSLFSREVLFYIGLCGYFVISASSFIALSSWEVRLEGSGLAAFLQKAAVAFFILLSMPYFMVRVFRTGFDIPGAIFGIFSIYCVLSSLWSIALLESFVQGICFAYFFLAFNSCADVERRIYFNALRFSSLGIAILIVLAFIIYPVHNDRTVGGIQPNQLAKLSITCLFLCFMSGVRGVERTCLVCFSLLVLIFSGSRGGIAYLILALIGYAAVSMRSSVSRNKLVLLTGLGLLVLCGAIAIALNQHVTSIISDKLAINDAERGLDSGFSGRTDHWFSGYEAFIDNPMFGVGFKVSQDVILAHSGFLNLAIDLGGVGFIIFIFSFFCKLFILYSRKWRVSPVYFSVSIMLLAVWIVDPIYINLGNPFSVLLLLPLFVKI